MATSLNSAATGLERCIKPVSRMANYISLGFLLIMPLPVFFDVIARFAVRGSLPGGIEIESFILLIIYEKDKLLIILRSGEKVLALPGCETRGC